MQIQAKMINKYNGNKSMKTFRQYLAESVRTYSYKLKIAGSPDKNWLQIFLFNLQKFDPVHIGDPRSTPIQEDPYGFPQFKNEPVTTIDVEFRYPCIEAFVKAQAKLLNYDENRIRLIQKDFDEGIAHEASLYSNQADHSPLLNHTELEDNGKQASHDYGNSYLNRIKKQMDAEKTNGDITFSAKRTQITSNPFEEKKTEGDKQQSPFSKTSRPAKPTVNARRSK